MKVGGSGEDPVGSALRTATCVVNSILIYQVLSSKSCSDQQSDQSKQVRIVKGAFFKKDDSFWSINKQQGDCSLPHQEFQM